jgi:hypothetical protein
MAARLISATSRISCALHWQDEAIEDCHQQARQGILTISLNVITQRGEPMTEDLNTKDLNDSEKLNLILAELASLRQWRMRADTFIEDRSRDTSPMLERIHKEIADTRFEMNEHFQQVEGRLDVLEKAARLTNHKIDELALNIFETRVVQRELGHRVDALESRSS